MFYPRYRYHIAVECLNTQVKTTAGEAPEKVALLKQHLRHRLFHLNPPARILRLFFAHVRVANREML